jgi:hypothetical protein
MLTDILWEGLIKEKDPKSPIEILQLPFGDLLAAMEIVQQRGSGNVGRVSVHLVRISRKKIHQT